MTDTVPKAPSHEMIKDAFKGKPIDTLARLPDCTETREAARLLDVAADLAHQTVERVEAEEARRQN